jgi:hypothetical protein
MQASLGSVPRDFSGELGKASRYRLPEGVAVDAVILVNHEVAIANRLSPNGFAKQRRIGVHQLFAQVTHPIAERLKREW